MVIWMVVLLIAQVQYEYDLVRVVCTRAFVCMLHSQKFCGWLLLHVFWCVYIPSSCCAWNVNLEVLVWLRRSFSIGRWDSKSLYVGHFMSFKSHIIHRLFWSMYVSVCWTGKWDLVMTGAKLSLYQGYEKQCPSISDLPQWWRWAAVFWKMDYLDMDFIFQG